MAGPKLTKLGDAKSINIKGATWWWWSKKGICTRSEKERRQLYLQ